MKPNPLSRQRISILAVSRILQRDASTIVSTPVEVQNHFPRCEAPCVWNPHPDTKRTKSPLLSTNLSQPPKTPPGPRLFPFDYKPIIDYH